MQLKGRRFEPATDPPRLTVGKTAAYVAAILIGLGIFKLLDLGFIRSPFAPAPTSTRMGLSYAEEGKAFFDAGILNKAIVSYHQALGVDPDEPVWWRNDGDPGDPATWFPGTDTAHPEWWAELARIQTYSSELMLSTEMKKERLEAALNSIAAAIGIDPDFAQGWAIKTLVLDWYASSEWMDGETRERTLVEANQASAQALLLDPSDALALAFRAEVLVDQASWSTALDVGAQAAQLGPEIMDVHRAFAYVLESNGYYSRAVEEYLEAIRLNTNLPFLYMRLGANYRKLGEIATDTATRELMIDDAIEAFLRAADLNPADPIPQLSIAQTYANQGDFFAAEIYARKALSLDDTNPYLYGKLGVIYYKAKNYETAIKVLRCAVRGCSAEENEEQGVEVSPTPLTARTVDIFYTFGSVLSFYGNEPGNCEEAARVFAELRDSPYNSEIVEGIIREGEVICAAFAKTPAP